MAIADTDNLGFFDRKGSLLRTVQASDLEALRNFNTLVARPFTCFITANHGKPRFLGSGTLVQVGEGIYVATAKHLFESLAPEDFVAVCWGEKDYRAGVRRDRIIEASGDLDLAALALEDQYPDVGVSRKQVEFLTTPQTDDLFVINGLPYSGFKCDDERQTVTAEHYSLGLVSLPHEAWPKVDSPLSSETDLLFNYSPKLALDEQGKPMDAVDPHGLSGGGIWHISIDKTGKLLPSEARLVAVQRSTNKEDWSWLRATQIRLWFELIGAAQE